MTFRLIFRYIMVQFTVPGTDFSWFLHATNFPHQKHLHPQEIQDFRSRNGENVIGNGVPTTGPPRHGSQDFQREVEKVTLPSQRR